MVSNQSNASTPLASTTTKAKRMTRTRRTSGDRHLKVNGKDRRIRLPFSCAERVFELTKKLGNRTSGQTIEWLMEQAEASVNAVLLDDSKATTPPLSPVETKPMAFPICPNFDEAKEVFVFAGDIINKETKPMVLPPFKYGTETEMEFSSEEIAMFFFPSSTL